MPRIEFRFGVGTPEEPTSATWKLWTKGDDAYLAARMMEGMLKLSMHAPRQTSAPRARDEWAWAFSTESGVIVDGNRRIHVWDRPPPSPTGWTRGPALMVPWIGPNRLARHHVRGTKPVSWWSSPPPAHKRIFAMMLAGAGVEAVAATDFPGTEIVAILPMRTLGRMVALTWIAPMIEADKWITDLAADIKVTYANPAGVAGAEGLSVLNAQTSEEGQPVLIEIVLGPENLRWADEAQSRPV